MRPDSHGDPRALDPEALAEVSSEYMQHHRVLPIRREGRYLIVAHLAGEEDKVRELGLFLGTPVRGEVWDRPSLERTLRQHTGVGAQALRFLSEKERGGAQSITTGSDRATLDGLVDDAAIVQFVNELLLRAYEEGATDVHIEPAEDRLRVRLRIDGFLHEIPVPPQVHQYQTAVVSRIKVMANLDIAEHRLPQDGRIKARIGGEEFDYRVSVLPSQYGEAVNVRVLANAAILLGLEKLGLWEDELRTIEALLSRPHGVILVTGPTGSGKTTTLYSFLNVLNEEHRKILTIEDPTEYNLDRVTQIQVEPRIGLTFATGLRSMLRHDPDVMMVGEIRDQETAETVVRVALTGHLVLSTVHTNDAPSTPARLTDMGVEPYLLGSSVESILGQRLVRLLCECAVPDPEAFESARRSLPPQVRDSLGDEIRNLQIPIGCEECRGTGYRGRTAIFEILSVDGDVRDAIHDRAPARELERLGRRLGYRSLRERGVALALQGRTSLAEVLRVTADGGRETGAP